MLKIDQDNVPHSKTNFNPFKGPEVERILYTTESQAEIWIACKMGGKDANRAYNESVSLILTGELNKKALHHALQTLIARHESLRAVFSTDGRFMTILKELEIPPNYFDISESSNSEKEQYISKYVLADANYIFDLVKGPLFKIGLIKTSETEHYLILTAHHIICDGWSTGIMLEELGSLYSAQVTDSAHNLPRPESFCAYADDQQNYLNSNEHKTTASFWINQFKDTVPELDLPTDFPRPKLRTYKSERLDFSMGSNLVASLKQTGVKSGCSLVTTLLSAFEVFLHLQTGQDDIVLGLPSADQAASGRTQMIGHCVNLLPLRSKVSFDQSFNAYLKARKPALFDAYEHQKLSFGELLQKLAIARDPSRVPLVPVVFNIDMGMSEAVSFSGLDYKLKSNPRSFEAFEIFLNATGTEDDLILEWSYNTSLFKPETIERMMLSFKELIKKLVENPNSDLKEVLKADQSIYDTLNATVAPYPKLTLHELVSETAITHADKTAIQFGSDTFSYNTIKNQTNSLSHKFVELGVMPSSVVAVALPKSPNLVITLLAILNCGAAYLPLDPSYPEERLKFMLEDSGAEILISEETIVWSKSSNIKSFTCNNLFSNLSTYPVTALEISFDHNQTAYLLYTSGSTGKPKGVEVSHKNLVNFLYSMLKAPGIEETDKLLSITTISFDIVGLELFLPLIKGATLVVGTKEMAKDTRLLLEIIEQEKITFLQATPTTWQMMLDTGWEKPLPIKALCGGEALTLTLAHKLLDKVNELWNMYGPTETTIWSSVKQITLKDDIITIGQPIANTQIYILNEQDLLMAEGSKGEIVIAGDGVAKGYWKRPELTSEKFLDNPFDTVSNSRMYRTGDLGQLLPNGELRCLGRIDQQVKLRGHRIELEEIEQTLDSLDNIESSVVLVHKDILLSYMVSNTIESLSESQKESWKSQLQKKLPAHMVPQEFHLLKEFPKTLNGKIDRNALLNISSNKKQIADYTAPRTETEKIIAKIWQECLKLEKVDVFSNFFELGGHSLVAVKVMSMIEKETEKRLPLSALMLYPTVEQLSEYIEEKKEAVTTWDSLVPIKTEGIKTPLYVVHGAGHNVLFFNSLAKNLDKNQPVYGLQARGLNGIDKPFDKIEDMAAHYVAEIMKTNPNGPYALAGYSFGGIIAFEMARQLQAQGKEVKKLAMFDSYVFPKYYYPDTFRKQMVSGLYVGGKVFFAIYKLCTSKEVVKLRLDTVKETIKNILNKNSKEDHSLREAYKPAQELDKMHEVAVNRYCIIPQDIKVDLLVADENVYFKHDAKFFGWKKLALGGVNKHFIPGNHANMFSAPNDKELGKILQNVLDGNI